MNNLIKISFLFSFVFAMTSCEKESELDLNTANSKYVIEAEIVQDATAKVKITKTVNFSDANNFPTIKGATVTISNDAGISEQLVETTDGIYESKKMKGEEGKTYTLTVTTDGNTFVAKSTMPKQVKLEGLKSQLNVVPIGNGEETYILFPKFIDPIEQGNSYQFIQSKGNEIDKSIVVSNDNVGNGLPNSRPIFSRNFKLKLGDTISVEMRCLDKVIYDYFYTLDAISGGGPGGGTAPYNPTNNFGNAALGYFSAHTTQKMEVIIK
jgi:hypothetical protein